MTSQPSSSKIDCKVVLLGQHDVGKTSLVERYVHSRFTDGTTATVGAAFAAKRVSVGDVVFTLGIWDTAGAERYESMSRIYYRSSKAALLCWDMTAASSFAKAKFWLEELRATEEQCRVYLVGCKADLLVRTERAVPQETVRAYAQQVGAKVFETSALTGQGVQEVFDTVARDFVAAMRENTALAARPPSPPIPPAGDQSQPPRSTCPC